jgi:hypothetical protein
MKENKNRLLLLLLHHLLLSKRSPNVKRQTILALQRTSTASKSINDTLRLWRETRKVDWFGRGLRTVAVVTLSVNEHSRTQSSTDRQEHTSPTIDRQHPAHRPIIAYQKSYPFRSNIISLPFQRHRRSKAKFSNWWLRIRDP